MRVLYQRHHSNGQSFPGSESESVGRRNQAGDVRRPVPVWRECANHTRYQAVCRGGESVKPLDTLKAMSPDALGALESAGISRRKFIKGSGALIISFSMGGLASPLGAAPGQAVPPDFNGPGSGQLDSWIAIGADGSVTAYTGKCELGQGLYTAQMQLIAEELSVPFERVKLIQCDTGITPDQGTTSGSQSHPTNFNQGNLALAGATAREALLRLASARLGVTALELAVRDGVISVKTDPSRRVSYGELVGGRTFNLPLSRTAKRKDPGEWTV